MTELVASVRLKADGSGVVGQANAAAAAVMGVGTAAAEASGGAKALATATAGADTATRSLATGAAGADQALDRLGKASRDAAAGQRQVASVLDTVDDKLVQHGRQLREVANDNQRNAFGVRNFGQQVGDLAIMIQGGISPARAFATQAGQMGYALSEMSGTAGKVGKFLTGPWGIALTIATSVGLPFVEMLFDGSKAAEEQRDRLEKAATAADSYGAAQTLLGKIVDLSTGKIKTQNVALQQQIRLLAQANILDAQKRQQAAASSARELVAPSFVERASVAYAGIGSATAGSANVAGAGQAAQALADRLAPVREAIDGYVRLTEISGASQGALDKGLDATIRRLDALGRTGKLAGRDLIDAKQAVLSLATAVNDQRVNQQVVDVLDGGAVPGTLKPYARGKKPPKPKSTAARDEFGRDAADRIATLTDRFDQTPEALRRAQQEVRQLDDLIDDLRRKKPVGFEKLIADAEAAKVVIRRGLIDGVAEAFEKPRTLADQAARAFAQLDAIAADLEKRQPPGFNGLLEDVDHARTAIRDGLNRPFDEYVESQAQSYQIGQLVAQGRLAEADTLRAIVQLEKARGPLSAEQKAAVLASNQALAAQERQIERLHRRQQAYLNALGDVQNIVRQTIYDGPDGIKELPSRLADAFKRFTAERLTENLFGEAFEKLRDQVTGADVVEDASDRMAVAIDAVTGTTGRTTSALDGLTRASNDAARAIGARADAGDFGTTRDAGGRATSDLLAGPAGIGDGQIGEALQDIVVTGRRLRGTQVDPFAGSIGQIATVLGKKIGIDDAKAERIGSSIGGFASKGLRGAVEGQAAASVAGMLGIRTSGTGSSIGGALGALSGIPGGSILGGLAGGIIGGLFSKPKSGSATIGAVDGQAAVTGTSGNDRDLRNASSGLASSVAGQLDDIVQQLGGSLGSFAVSIGQKDGKYVVDNSGRGSTKYGKSGDGITAYKTAEEAQAAALVNAIADGAVQGVSTAVATALRSSTDVDKAVQEALKVQQLETLLGGVSGQLTTVFKQIDAEAAERVRLAKKYGLDLLQVEKVNAEERADLVSRTLKARVQPLNDLIASMTSGDLFEGDAGQRRDAIRKELEAGKAAADRGDDGAIERYAQLLGQLVTTSREGFGTAGSEYRGDRAFAAAEAARLIKVEEDRVREAAGLQAATTKAVEDVGRLTDEGNDTLAEIERGIQQLVQIAQRGGGITIRPDLSLVSY